MFFLNSSVLVQCTSSLLIVLTNCSGLWTGCSRAGQIARCETSVIPQHTHQLQQLKLKALEESWKFQPQGLEDAILLVQPLNGTLMCSNVFFSHQILLGSGRQLCRRLCSPRYSCKYKHNGILTRYCLSLLLKGNVTSSSSGTPVAHTPLAFNLMSSSATSSLVLRHIQHFFPFNAIT